MGSLVPRTLRDELLLIDSLSVNISKQRLPTIFGGEVEPVVDEQATVGVPAAKLVGGSLVCSLPKSRFAIREMRVVGNRFDIFVYVGVEVAQRNPLAQVIRPWEDMPEMRNHAGFRKELALCVVIQPPRVGGALCK